MSNFTRACTTETMLQGLTGSYIEIQMLKDVSADKVPQSMSRYTRMAQTSLLWKCLFYFLLKDWHNVLSPFTWSLFKPLDESYIAIGTDNTPARRIGFRESLETKFFLLYHYERFSRMKLDI